MPPEEITQAEQKLEESLELADNSMHNLISGDVSCLFKTVIDFAFELNDLMREQVITELCFSINYLHL